HKKVPGLAMQHHQKGTRSCNATSQPQASLKLKFLHKTDNYFSNRKKVLVKNASVALPPSASIFSLARFAPYLCHGSGDAGRCVNV
ncbi:hypothetical protein, partial [Nitrosomonas sp.]|uniref:hypothetical protein n=1 Tax=Nitrosomonas sp. TaxID=42353 RepID=UPI001D552152